MRNQPQGQAFDLPERSHYDMQFEDCIRYIHCSKTEFKCESMDQ